MRIDHVFLGFPPGHEAACRAFWTEIIGMDELEKPENLKGEGGGWFKRGSAGVHIGPDPDFVVLERPHPAFATDRADQLAQTLAEAGHPVRWDDRIPGVRRFFTEDPVGNTIEFIAETS